MSIISELARYCRTGGRSLYHGILLLFCWSAPWAGAVGLGEVQVQSSLGQALRASVPILGGQTSSILPSCVKARLQTVDATFIAALSVSINDDSRPAVLILSSSASVQEPVLTLVLEVSCDTNISRHYQILLDPPESLRLTLPQIQNSPVVSPDETVGNVAEQAAQQRRKPGANKARPQPSAAKPLAASDAALPGGRERNKVRNVLKVDAVDSGTAKPSVAPLPDGTPLQLVLSRRLHNDSSPVASVAQEVFSDKVRQQQNQAVLTELERAEMKFMQQKIQSLAVEINRLRQVQPQALPQPQAEPPAPVPAVTQAAPEAQANPVAVKPPAPARLPMQDPSAGQNSIIILGGGFIFILLGAGFVYKKRKEKQDLQFATSSMFKETGLSANSLLDTNGGQSIDTNSSVFNSNFMPSASQLDTNEVDPVAEAGVYIAYGRDVQAEEILREAIRLEPNRHAAHVKLLEIYANRKDVRSFEVQASQLYSMTQGEGEDWAFAASIGLSIDPTNPLYGGVEEVCVVVPMPEPSDPWHNTVMPSDLQASVEDQPIENGLAAAVSANDGIHELDFDLDVLLSPASQAESTFEAAALTDSAQPELSLPELSFDLEQALPTMPEMPEMHGLVEFDFELPNLPDDDAEMIIASIPVEDDGLDSLYRSINPVPVAALPMLPSAEPALELVVPAPVVAPAANFQAPEAAAVADTAQSAAEVENEPFSNVIEMATRIDLAMAYQEIGYKEGARELIDEVIKGGTPEQIERAKAMRAKIA